MAIADPPEQPDTPPVAAAAFLPTRGAWWLWPLALVALTAGFAWFPQQVRPLQAMALLWVMLLSLVLHELGHALAAEKAGDPTPRRLGRMTLDPRVHFDPVGSLWLPLATGALLLATGVGLVLGWARPIPVSFPNLREGARDQLRVVLAGPLASALLAYLSLVGCALTLLVLARLDLAAAQAVQLTPKSDWLTPPVPATYPAGLVLALSLLRWGILVNMVLLVFNLLPVLPLDGGWLVRLCSPRPLRSYWERWQAGVFVLVAGLALSGLLLAPVAGLWTVALLWLRAATGGLG